MKKYARVVAALTGVIFVVFGVLVIHGANIGESCNHLGRRNCTLERTALVLFGQDAANWLFGCLWIALGVAFIFMPRWINR